MNTLADSLSRQFQRPGVKISQLSDTEHFLTVGIPVMGRLFVPRKVEMPSLVFPGSSGLQFLRGGIPSKMIKATNVCFATHSPLTSSWRKIKQEKNIG